jgi:hypothetical protein
MNESTEDALNRERIVREAVYAACCCGYYDTNGALVISMFDGSHFETLPPNATHRFYIMIDRSAYVVTRFAENHYEIEVDARWPEFRREHELRTAVLDCALRHLTGELASTYQPGASAEERERVIASLVRAQEAVEHPVPKRPIVQEEPLDPFLLANHGPAPLIERQWSVYVGWQACRVSLVGYRKNGAPELAASDLPDNSSLLDDEVVQAGLALRRSLSELEQGFPAMLARPSHLLDAESTIYGAVLALLLESSLPAPLANPVREFLVRFHEALEHRRKVTTWEHNGQWFAARTIASAAGDVEQTVDAQGPAASEGAALELLYKRFPELR